MTAPDRPRAIFFDMDDTLLDGVAAATLSWDLVCAETATSLGCEAQKLRDAIRREGAAFWKDESLVGHWRLDLEGAREIVVRTALEAEGLDSSLARKVAHDYAAAHRTNLALFADAIETLEAVRGAGLATALITNGPKAMQRDKIARFGLESYFDVIVIEGEFGKGKPEREVFLHALETLRISPDQAWHIGDNLYADVSGAQAVGVHATWIHRERLKMDESPIATPDRVIAHLHELAEPLGI